MNLDLVATCWTTAGDAFPEKGHEVSPIPLETRIAEVASAGFRGIGLLDHDLRHFLMAANLRDLRGMLDEHGLDIVELEFLGDWWKPDSERFESDEVRRLLMDAALTLNARSIKVSPDLNPNAGLDLDTWIPRFIELCNQADDVGTTIAIEFMPFSNMPDLQAGLDFVMAGDHPAGGLFIDTWHVERSGSSYEDLASVPLRFVKGVEIDDALPAISTDMYDETIHRRTLPGGGEFNVTAFIQALVTAGWQGPWGVEIIAADHRLRPLQESLPDVVSTTLDAFERAGILKD